MIALKAHFDGRVIVPDEPVDLPRGQRLIVQLQTDGPRTSNGEETRSVFEWLAENAVDDPSIPVDLSFQHDHYLYGTPKKPEPKP
jgi:hypothetical protein